MRRLLLVVGILVGLLLVAIAWMAVTGRTAWQELTAARTGLNQAQAALVDGDVAQADKGLQTAQRHSAASRAAIEAPVWSAAAVLPGLGSSVRVTRSVIVGLDQALFGLGPVAQWAIGDQAANLISGSRIDLAALAQASPALSAALAGLISSEETLRAAPAAGGFLGSRISEVHGELETQVVSLRNRLGGWEAAARLAPPLLGQNGAQDYLLAVLNPNEARGGGGGFIGNFAVLRADTGKLSVSGVASNDALEPLEQLPADLPAGFLDRYGKDARNVGNMNLSPDFPTGARLWLAAYQQTFGKKLDGVLAIDVVAVGAIMQALGQQATLPDGSALGGAELTDFALLGIYDRFPTSAQSAERSAFQTETFRSALDQMATFQTSNPGALLRDLGQQSAQGRLQLYSAVPELQRQLAATTLGGSLSRNSGSNATVSIINSSASKLDAFLHPNAQLTTSGCSGVGPATSKLTLELTSVIPPDRVIPPYVISQAPVGPAGPINVTTVQFHLPIGAKPGQLRVNGEAQEYLGFSEQDRPAVAFGIELPPRITKRLELEFTSPLPASELRLQPTASAGLVQVQLGDCQPATR